MTDTRTTTLASLIVLVTGAFWGFYWIPVRALAATGLEGAWGTLSITLAASLLLMPVALRRRRELAGTSPVVLLSVALGGAAFTLYSVGFVYGRVAIVILLYFLTPVWSTLIGRYLMGWHTPRRRLVAIAVGLAGLGIMLGADGQAPLPSGAGEWMALAAGLLWSFATTGIRAKPALGPLEAAFVFAAGASLAALALTLSLAPLPTGEAVGAAAGRILILSVFTGGSWWVLSTAALMWAAPRLDPARVGILLMSEVAVGAASAALLAGEHLTALEVAGGAMVLAAGVLEMRRSRR
jgi:drug/metabolite transporter (DMT)-like permease